MIKYISFFVPFCVLLHSCSGLAKTQRYEAQYTFRSNDGNPDYTRLVYWAAHPGKRDPSDSLPASLRDRSVPVDTGIDVFYIHPTTYTTEGAPLGPNAPLDDPSINAATDYRPILYQASAFNAYRVFAPRYRQAHLTNYYTQNFRAAKSAFGLAYEDVKAAFLYYLAHWNQGRPFLIASHSQGTTHGKRLLTELIDNKPLSRQLVAAYLVGIPVPATQFAALKGCEKPASTGCIVSWRTMQTGYLTPEVARETDSVLLINPLSFDADIPEVTRSENPGSLMPDFNKLLPGKVNAAVHGNVIWADKPSVPGAGFMGKNYHVADYNFYWLSIRRNAALRVASFRTPVSR